MQPSLRGKSDVPPDSFDPRRSTCLPDLTVYMELVSRTRSLHGGSSTTIKAELKR